MTTMTYRRALWHRITSLFLHQTRPSPDWEGRFYCRTCYILSHSRGAL